VISDPSTKKRLTSFLGQYLSESRLALIEKILSERTRHITVVLEDIYQSQNGSAVMRTCECMGLQDVHVIENTSKYSVNRRVLKGANKWINLIRHNVRGKDNAQLCFHQLKSEGYRIYVTDPSGGLPIHEVPIDQKVALVMGNELRGASGFSLDHADEKVTIPMYGFTESLNISVSAAICLNSLVPKLRASHVAWQLTEEEQVDLRLAWYKKCVRNPELLEREFYKREATATQDEIED
jgi:tRNA (guanosine-2'-O-)-methyltransferase